MRSSKVFSYIIVILFFTSQSVVGIHGMFTNSLDFQQRSSILENEFGSINSISLSQSDYTLPNVTESNVEIDGIISDSEYVIAYTENLNDNSDMSIYWEHDGENVTIGLVSEGTGWVAFGFTWPMNNSNMIMGGYAGGTDYCLDLVGIDWLHANDTDQLGSDDIIACSSTETLTTTTLEFTFPLDSGDVLDPILTVDSTYDMFVGYSTSDNILDTHEGHSFQMSVYIDSNEYTPDLGFEDFEKSIPLVQDSQVDVDGVVGVNEYSSNLIDGTTGIIAYWEHDTINLSFALVSPGTGWVALGIGENMGQSSMYMGGFKEGSTYCIDMDGIGQVVPVDDSDNGGEDNIIECQATETDTTTTLEFTIPLSSVDSLDTNMDVESVYKMFFAYHQSSDETTQIHTAYSEKYRILIAPEAISTETFLTLTTVDTDLKDIDSVEFNQTIIFKVNLTDPIGVLANIAVVFFMETQFGEVIFDTKITDSEGKAKANYTNPNLLYNHTFGARSLETIIPVSGNIIAYQSSESEQEIMFKEKIEFDDRAEKIRLSRIGLLVAFWMVGIVIWGGFGYTFYQMYQIFKGRNDEFDETSTTDTSKYNDGGNS